jgi:hypothetical protein
MILTLTRDYRDANLTLGTLAIGANKWQTLERPWVPDATSTYACGDKGVSCVPVGDYRLEPHNSEAHPKVWALVNPKLGVFHWDADVPPGCNGARTAVLIHAANWVEELRGCIAVGKSRLKTNGRWMVVRSRDALNEVRNVLGTTYELVLTIAELTACLPSSDPNKGRLA